MADKTPTTAPAPQSTDPKHLPWGKIIGALIVLLIASFAAIYYAMQPGIDSVDTADDTVVVVSDFTPDGEILAAATNINVDFNKEVVGADQVGQISGAALLDISPALSGQYRWISRSAFRFIPDKPLSDGTEYTVTVRDDIFKKSPLTLGGQRIYSFKTTAFAITDTSVNVRYTDSKHKKIKTLIDFSFNYLVSPRALEQSLLVNIDQEGTTSFHVTQKNPGTHLTVETKTIAATKKSRKVRVSLSRPLKADVGNMEIRAFERTMTMEGKKSLKIQNIQPSQQGDTNFNIRLRFSSYIDPKRAKNFIEVSPAVEYRVSSSWRNIILQGDFKSGSTYTVDVKKGLVGEDGALLEIPFSRRVVIPDFEPSVKFASPGLYLPLKGSGNVRVNSVNVKKINVSVTRVFANNIVHFLKGDDGYGYYGDFGYGSTSPEQLGKNLWNKDMSVAAKRNQVITSDIDIGSFVEEKYQGVFAVTARDDDSYWRRESKMIVATDMGVIGKVSDNKLMVFVNSLKTLKPYASATVTLISRTNQVMATAKTSVSGMVTFNNLGTLRKEFTPYVITVSKGKDFSFLKFANTRVPAADFDVGGNSIPQAWQYRSYLYTDRGVYRPDDKGHLVAIIRNRDLTEPTSIPVKLTVRAPDGRKFKTFASKIGDGGLVSFDLEFPRWAKTGHYSATLSMTTGDTLGTLGFQVEDFMPDQIKVETATEKPDYKPGDTVNIDVTGTMLFGPPAAGKYVEATVRINSMTFRPKDYGSFSFHNSNNKFSGMTRELGDTVLDDKGQHRFSLPLEDNYTPPSALKGVVYATVRDEGGRSVSGSTSFTIHPYPVYVGLAKTEEGYASPGEVTEFEAIALTPEGKPVSGREVEVELYRNVWHTTLKRDSRGRYRYTSEKERTKIESNTITTKKGVVKFSFTPKEYGSYEVMATDKASGASSSISFYASGWGYSPWAMSKPDRLNIDLDKTEYAPGDIATLQVRAPFSGKLILTVERDSIEETRIIDMKENTASIRLPVKADWAPNVYVVGSLIRSTDGLEEQAPARAFGAFPLKVSYKKYTLDVNIDAPREIRPDKDIKVTVSVPKGGARAHVTLAAVDEGILQLTGFASPNPLKHFFAKQRLGVDTHDMYGFLLPDIESAAHKSSSGGGADMQRQKNLNPIAVKRVKPVALWSGVVELDGSGKATIPMHVPQFNGSLRLMAVASKGDRFGSAKQNLTVADTIVLLPTVPRFLAPKDNFKLPVSVYNNTGKDGSFTVTMKTEGPVSFAKAKETVSIPSKKEAHLMFDGSVENAVGAASITVTASGNGQSTVDVTDLPVRPVNPLTIESGSGTIDPGKTVAVELPGDYLPGTAIPRLVITGLPTAKLGGTLQYLLKYPYGCLEQTTSKAFPLLYFQDLAKAIAPELFDDYSADYYVNEAIKKLESMQFGGGSFSVWPGHSSSHAYSSIYASHFLVEAKNAGYLVQDSTIDGIRRNMEVITGRSLSSDRNWKRRNSLDRRVYALYVLALMGDPDTGSQMYLKETELDNMSAYSRLRLASAFAYANDMKTAKELLPQKIVPSTDSKRETGYNFNSSTRANAIMLGTLTDIDPDNPAVAVLANRLVQSSKVGRYYTTQENAMAMLALGKMFKAKGNGTCSGSVKAGFATLAEFDDKGVTLNKADLAGKTLKISASGDGACYYFWQVEGVSVTKTAKEYDVDVEVRRTYLNKDGEYLDLNHIPHGELVVAEIEIRATGDDVRNLVIVDMLPAGFAIENPRLESRQSLDWLDKRYEHKDRFYTEYMDMRDDRLILFGDVYSKRPRVFYYALRAVTPGTFTVPSIKAEAMYNPVITSVASSSQITVEAGK